MADKNVPIHKDMMIAAGAIGFNYTRAECVIKPSLPRPARRALLSGTAA